MSSWDSFPSVGLLFQFQGEWFCFYLIVFYSVMLDCYLLESCYFPGRDRKGTDLDGMGGKKKWGDGKL